MPRIARVVVTHCPHHITIRGNRRQAVFFTDEDRVLYLRLLRRYAVRYGLMIWAYCLMENHNHLIAVPERPDSMNMTLREAHKKYTMQINIRMDWRGSLWQGRYHSFPLDGAHLYRAVRYVENNPVRARLVPFAEKYRWSSAASHVFGTPDPLLSPCPLQKGRSWVAYLRDKEEEEELRNIRSHIMSGRPLGTEKFIDQLEAKLGRELRPKKRGPKTA